jgi:hypothetical protein
MPVSLNTTEVGIFTVLRNFLLSVLPAGTEVIRGLDNRVAEPKGVNFVEMTPMFQERFAGNVDEYVEVLFVGSITGVTLTITQVLAGALAVGSSIFGTGVVSGTVITALGTGMGGLGTYTVNNTQTVGSEQLQAGTKTAEQYTQVTVQLDIHGPASANNAQIISTLFRDEYAVTMFEQSGIDMAPLYTSDPRQIPFLNGEQQIEERYIVDAVVQVNPIVTIPQQMAVLLGPVIIHDEI